MKILNNFHFQSGKHSVIPFLVCCSLPLNAYRRLRKVSEAHPEKKFSWCLQLQETLARVGLQHLYDRNSPVEIAESTPLVLRKHRQFLIPSDISKSSKLNPHYQNLKRSYLPAPILECGLPSCFATPIPQVRVNSNSVFDNGKWHDLGNFKHEPCKLCGNFYHTMWECPGTKQIRDSRPYS